MIECAVVMTPEEVIPDKMILLPGQEMGETAFKTLKASKQDFEKNYLIQLMKISQGNVSQASKLAGKDPGRTSTELLGKYRINPLDFRQE